MLQPLALPTACAVSSGRGIGKEKSEMKEGE